MASTVKPKKYVGNITASRKRLARWICCRKLWFSIVNRSRSHNFVVVLCGSVISRALLFVVSATTSAYNVDVSLKRAHFVATSWWAVNYAKQLIISLKDTFCFRKSHNIPLPPRRSRASFRLLLLHKQTIYCIPSTVQYALVSDQWVNYI